MLKPLAMLRLLLAQEALLPHQFARRAPWYARAMRAGVTLGAPRFGKSRAKLSDHIRKLGPTYIKIGQFLATRPDMVGGALAEDLRHLQDRLPAFSQAEATRILAQELENPDTLFTLEHPPIAAASIAQVHIGRRADTPDMRLAVKILRPNIARTLARELAVLFSLARWAERLLPLTRRLRPLAALETLAQTMAHETDLRLEAAAQSEMADNMKNIEGFRIPAIYWPATTRRVLAMEWVEGIAAGELAALDKAKIDRPALAVRLIRVFLTQALHHGFFHADMHQGNLLVEADGTLVAIDFGIVGRLDPHSRRFLADILYGFIRRDYHRVAQVHFNAGYVPPDQSPELFAQALRATIEPIRDLDSGDIPLSQLLTRLFEVTAQFNMATQPQLLLLQKTMVTVEGVARAFDPTLNFWDAAEPVIAKWLRQQMRPDVLFARARDTLESLADYARETPKRLARLERAHKAQRRRAKIWHRAALFALLIILCGLGFLFFAPLI